MALGKEATTELLFDLPFSGVPKGIAEWRLLLIFSGGEGELDLLFLNWPTD